MGGRLVEIREEVPRFYSDLDKVAGEEAEARQVEPGGKEEMWKGGVTFFKQARLQFDAARSFSAATPTSYLGGG